MGLSAETTGNRGESLEKENAEMIEVATVRRIIMPSSRPLTGLIDLSDSLVVTNTFPTRKILLGIYDTGQYVQRSTVGDSGLVGDVLDSIEDGALMMEEAPASVGPKNFFIVRMYYEIGGERHYLVYDQAAGDRSRVQSLYFSNDTISSENLDGRCFVKNEYGNYTIFRSIFRDDLWLYYDSRGGDLKMGIRPKIIGLFRRFPWKYMFTIENVESRRRRDTRPQKINIFSGLTSCFKHNKIKTLYYDR